MFQCVHACNDPVCMCSELTGIGLRIAIATYIYFKNGVMGCLGAAVDLLSIM